MKDEDHERGLVGKEQRQGCLLENVRVVSFPQPKTPLLHPRNTDPKEAVQGTELHEFRQHHDRPALGDYTFQSQDIGVLELAQ